MREVPAGRLRLTVPRTAVPLFIEPIVLQFRQRHPKVELEVSIDDERVDLAQDGFDAGIRLGEFIDKDMIGIRLSTALRWRIVGSPGYFAERGHPRTPRDLDKHELIRFRFTTRGGLPRWVFTEKGKTYQLDTPRGIVINDGICALALARRGCGLAYVPDPLVEDEVAAGTLVSTLDPYMPTSPGFFLYFPAGSQLQPKLRAFIAVITEHLQSNRSPSQTTTARQARRHLHWKSLPHVARAHD
jgi:DNA-binding transcriptional LysR family regulator